MAVSYADFGFGSPGLYAAYLYACCNGYSSNVLAAGQGVHSSVARGTATWRAEVGGFAREFARLGELGFRCCDGRGDWACDRSRVGEVCGGSESVSDVSPASGAYAGGEPTHDDGGVIDVAARSGDSDVVGCSGRSGESVGVGLESVGKKKKLGSRARRRLRGEVRRCGVAGKESDKSDFGAGDDSVVPEWRRGARVVGDESSGRRFARGNGGFFSEASAETRNALRESRADRLVAENRLATFKAHRQLEVESSQDVVQLKKRQETRLLRDTECNKVQIERAYGTLAATGNVPGVGGSVAGGGKVEGTVVTNGASGLVGGSISPNSSASMKEFHAMQKENLSLFKDKMDLEAKLERLKLMEPEAYKRIGGGYRRPETVDTGYTVDTDGNPTGLLPEGHCGGEIKEDGRFHFHPDIMDDYDRW